MIKDWKTTGVILVFFFAQTYFCQAALGGDFSGKTILMIDSYHSGYAWSDGIVQGAQKIVAKEKASFSVYHMDTKRNSSQDFKIEAGKQAKAYIDKLKPDIVIACDDNASKYLVEPYFKDASLPFVFCGVNLDASTYGYPYDNATGMVEVSIYPPMLKSLKILAKGKRLGILGTDKLTARKEAEFLRQNDVDKFIVRYPKSFAEWKIDFLFLQERSDFMIIWSSAGLDGWDAETAKKFILKNVRVPLGTTQQFMMPYALIGFVKIAEEQGEWAMTAALKILNGKKPNEISIVKNKHGRLLINDSIAQALKIKLPISMVEIADEIIR